MRGSPILRGIIFITLIGSSISVRAQSGLGSWNIIQVKINQNKNWSFFTEAQLRSLGFYNDFHYYELKGGVNYKIDDNFSLSAGIGNYDTYSPGGNFKAPLVSDELRTWLQLSMIQYVKRFRFEHRYRAEQRFVTTGYRNRFRYRFNVIVPVSGSDLSPGTVFLSVWNEVFFNNQVPHFERNRLYAGLGVLLRAGSTLQAGYVDQTDYKINDETGKSFFQISWLLEFKNKKKKGQNIPSNTD